MPNLLNWLIISTICICLKKQLTTEFLYSQTLRLLLFICNSYIGSSRLLKDDRTASFTILLRQSVVKSSFIRNYSDVYISLPLNLFKNNVNIKKCKRSAATRDRTRDLTIFSRTLSQLSYCGVLTFQRQLRYLSRLTSANQTPTDAAILCLKTLNITLKIMHKTSTFVSNSISNQIIQTK